MYGYEPFAGIGLPGLLWDLCML